VTIGLVSLEIRDLVPILLTPVAHHQQDAFQAEAHPCYTLSRHPAYCRQEPDVSMPIVRFTANIQRHVECPSREVSGDTLRHVLESYFRDNERARGYVFDDQGRLRQHMAIFIDGQQVQDRRGLTDRVAGDAVVDLVQALSGG
jgi:sulfur-carrier protein